MKDLKFTSKKTYDKGYGYQTDYVLNEWMITKISYNSWSIERNGNHLFSVGTLTIAKNYVCGVVKMESK